MLSIILPTYNEGQNFPELFKRIAGELGKSDYEVIVVDDDSPDRTWEVAEKLRKTHHMIRVIRRIGRRGLSSAVVEGFDAARGDVLLVMDSDLQHDPSLITKLADAVEHDAGIAVASRYMKGGSVGEWVRGRRLLSNTATWLAKNIPAVHVSDPMSGFFALRRPLYHLVRPRLHPTGFKILFEILGHLPRGTKTKEVPLVFKMRLHGESKLSMWVQLQFLMQLLRITLIRFQALLFWTICLLITAVLLIHLIPILPLYTDAGVRSQVQQTLESVARQNGWLMSDITIRAVKTDHILIAHRPHRFGRDPDAVCYAVLYADPALTIVPCAD